MRRRPTAAGEMPDVLSSPVATDEDGRTWLDVETWERARAMWPEDGWNIGFTLPDEPFSEDML